MSVCVRRVDFHAIHGKLYGVPSVLSHQLLFGIVWVSQLSGGYVKGMRNVREEELSVRPVVLGADDRGEREDGGLNGSLKLPICLLVVYCAGPCKLTEQRP